MSISIPLIEKETAADRYADKLASVLHAEGKIPFERLVDANSLERDNLALEWF